MMQLKISFHHPSPMISDYCPTQYTDFIENASSDTVKFNVMISEMMAASGTSPNGAVFIHCNMDVCDSDAESCEVVC